jgi:glycosyltransferase involved in cell wall biosynthesis
MRNVRFLGHQPRERVQEEMGAATALIVPSLWYEAFGLTVVEAFAKGTPVIGSAIGAIPSLVVPGRSGLLFPPGEEQALATLLRTWTHQDHLRTGARAAYEERFTPERNYAALMEIYSSLAAGASN